MELVVLAKITPAQQYAGGVPANLFGEYDCHDFGCHGTASSKTGLS